MAGIQFGWVLPMHVRTHGELFHIQMQRALDLIAGHFDSIWCTDHLQDQGVPLLEGWTTLTYLAARHPQFFIGHTVLCQSFRNPALLAKMAATLQYLSSGRLILGIGAGRSQEEYQAYGYEFSPAATRVEELEETLLIIKALWHNSSTTVEGKYHAITNAYCEPKPDPLPPIMIGGSRPRLLQVVARHADWWSADRATISDYRKQVEACERACAQVNRDPISLRRTWSGGCICCLTEQAIKPRTLIRQYPDYGFVGTPEQVIAQMQPFIALGVDYFMVETADFPDLTTLELLVSEVIPVLRRSHR